MVYDVEKWKAVASQFVISNDYVFGSVLSHSEICTRFIQLVIPELRLKQPVKVTKQVTAAVDSKGKSIRLDIKAVDEKGQIYDIKMQNINSLKDLEPRIRYYGSLIDCDTIGKGDKYRKLPNAFIIFVCNFDYKGYGKSLYDFSMRDQYDPSIELHDGRRVILVNCKEAHNLPDKRFESLSRFIQYVQTNTPNDDFTHLVHHYVQESKKKPAERKEFMEYLSMESKIAYLNNELKNERNGRLQAEAKVARAEEEMRRLKELLAKYMAEEDKKLH